MSVHASTPEGAVTLFCRQGCRKCERIRSWLIQIGMTITLVDPSTDEEARTYLLEHGFRGMPVVRTSDGRLARGAEPEQLSAALPILDVAERRAGA